MFGINAFGTTALGTSGLPAGTTSVTPTVTSIVISPSSTVIASGASRQYTAVALGVNPPQAVTWSKTGPGTLGANGAFTAPVATTSAQSTTITATSDYNGVSASVTVVVASVGVSPGVGVYPAATDVLAGVPYGPTGAEYIGTLVVEVIAQPITGVAGPRSLARTFVVTEPQVAQDTSEGKGTFFSFANPAKPKGVKDPSALLEVVFDWSPWLADSDDTYSHHDVILTGGLVLAATNHEAGEVSIFVQGGTLGQTAAVTCRVHTNSTPPRKDDRTVYLRIKNL